MKKQLFRLRCFGAAILALSCISANLLAQVPFNYRLEYKQMPAGTTSMNIYDVGEISGGLFAVGSYSLGGITRGFIYDQANDQFTDIYDLFGLTGFNSSCRGVNSSGIIMGNIQDAAGSRSYWFDYFANPPTLNFLDQQFPLGGSHARDINIHGDMLITSSVGVRVVNPFDFTMIPVDDMSPAAISDTGFVVGSIAGNTGAVRWHPIYGKQVFPNANMVSADALGEVNNLGEFGATIDDETGSPAAGWPCRISDQIDWTGTTTNAYYVSAVNNSGDLAYMATITIPTSTKPPRSTTVEKAFFYHASLDQVFRVDELISDGFLNGNIQRETYLTDRVSSLDLPTPVIIGTVVNDSTNDRRIYFLFPVAPPNPLVITSPDTPKSIPDNNTTGVTSTIAVAQDLTITNLTVTLNISHPRLSDLQATLIGPAPNNISVPLTNLTGLNDIGNFDGVSSQGNWRVKVVDTVRKQTGTLNGWTLTIEH